MFDIVLLCLHIRYPDISVNMVHRLGVNDPGISIRYSVGLEILRLSVVTRPALSSRHPAVLQVSGFVVVGGGRGA